MAKGFINGQMVINIKENGHKIKEVEKVSLNKQMEINMMVNGKMT